VVSIELLLTITAMTNGMKKEPILLDEKAALLVIDVQEGFDDVVFLGKRNNPAADENIRALIGEWEKQHRPIVVVQHNSRSTGRVCRHTNQYVLRDDRTYGGGFAKIASTSDLLASDH
jgi:hypothetical protein